jgi:hypothetical protein
LLTPFRSRLLRCRFPSPPKDAAKLKQTTLA